MDVCTAAVQTHYIEYIRISLCIFCMTSEIIKKNRIDIYLLFDIIIHNR